MGKSINFGEARHLVVRTGLGAEWQAIKALQGRSRYQAVKLLLSPKKFDPPPPPRMTAWNVRVNMLESKKPAHKMKVQEMMMLEGRRLKRWWISHMRRTPSPIIEKMTLFWHGHFTSSLDKVEQPSLLYKQHMLLRRHSLGNFAHMLKAIAKDPAMSVYLDGQFNEKNNPNENFARELLELFTLGHGHYREADVKNVAKIFTGWSVNRYQERYAYHHTDHDPTPRVVLGKRVNSGEQVIQVLLEHPRTAKTIAEKIWSLLISDAEPDKRITHHWAKHFQRSGYDIRSLLRIALNSDAFWSEENRGTITKSPADLVIGSVRTLPKRQSLLFNDKDLEGIFRLLGQDLFDPATVKGWKSGMEWIDTESLMVRASMLNKLTRGNLNAKIHKGYEYPNVTPEQYQQWLLALKPIKALPTTPGRLRLVRALALDPMYQLT